jgi:hypothetical protein
LALQKVGLACGLAHGSEVSSIIAGGFFEINGADIPAHPVGMMGYRR